MGKDLKGKELGEGLAQRKDGRYCARYVDRFGKRRSIYNSSLRELKNILADEISADRRKRNVIDDKVVLDEWYEKWLEIYKIPTVRPATIRIYRHIYETKISPLLGKTRIVDLTKLMITNLLNKLATDYAWETLNKTRLLLVDMLDRAMEDDFISKNPARGVRLPKNKPQRKAKALSRQDQKDFFECSLGTYYHNMFVVAVNTGLRPGELFALQEDDLDFQNREISVTKTLTYEKLDGDKQKTFHIGEPKTQSSKRVVPMNNSCMVALQKQLIQTRVIRNKTKTNSNDPLLNFVFCTKRGSAINVEIYNEAIERIVAEINLMRDELDEMPAFTGHTFRHTFATRSFEAGISPKTVQMYLGHASLQMTMDLYTTVFEEKKYEDILLLEESINDLMTPDKTLMV